MRSWPPPYLQKTPQHLQHSRTGCTDASTHPWKMYILHITKAKESVHIPVWQLWADFFWRVASRDKQCKEQEEEFRDQHVTPSFLSLYFSLFLFSYLWPTCKWFLCDLSLNRESTVGKFGHSSVLTLEGEFNGIKYFLACCIGTESRVDLVGQLNSHCVITSISHEHPLQCIHRIKSRYQQVGQLSC